MSYKNNDLKYQPQHGMMNVIYLVNHIPYQIFKIILNVSYKDMEKRLMTMIFQKNICKIKKRYYLELLTPETMSLLASSKSNIKR